MGIEYCLDEGKMYNYGRSTMNNCLSLGGWQTEELTEAGLKIFEWMGDGAN